MAISTGALVLTGAAMVLPVERCNAEDGRAFVAPAEERGRGFAAIGTCRVLDRPLVTERFDADAVSRFSAV